jgi:hypothetical protein
MSSEIWEPLDRVDPQPPSDLLGPPTPQHGLEHGVLRAQLRHPRDQHQLCRTCELTVRQPGPSSPVWRMDRASNGISPQTGCSEPAEQDSAVPIPERSRPGDLHLVPRLMKFPRDVVTHGRPRVGVARCLLYVAQGHACVIWAAVMKACLRVMRPDRFIDPRHVWPPGARSGQRRGGPYAPRSRRRRWGR